MALLAVAVEAAGPTALQLATSAILDPLRSFEAQLTPADFDALLEIVVTHARARQHARASLAEELLAALR